MCSAEVVAHHRRPRIQRGADVDDRRQDLVGDINELERVSGRVAVPGDDEGDLLTLEADLVRGEHGLDVIVQRGHPRQALLGELLSGDGEQHPWMRLRRAHIDAGDAGMGVGATQ